ncbi:MAG: ankyrin repeat domain-containing protein, partial [Deltaproteobacteria bacterium]|nr:ankyrin repeat domain-containing protein [Deltaproteobacteria bacterium]
MKFVFTVLLLIASTLLLAQNACAERSVPALIDAIWKNDAAKVERLISQGVDVNVKHDDTALVEAVSVDPKKINIEIVKMLLNTKGIEVNKYSTRPMGSYSWYRTPLIAAVSTGNVEAVKLLLAKGAKVNLVDQHLPVNVVFGPAPLNSALMYAAEKGLFEIAELLLDKGANIEQMNATGLTPLMFSVHIVTDKSDALTKENAVKVAAVLLKRGAKVDNCGFSSNIKFLKVALPKGTPSSVNPNVIVRGGGGISA